MAETFDGRVSINRIGTTDATVVLDAQSGNLTLGNHGQDGDVLLRDAAGETRIHLDPGNHTVKVFDADSNLLAELGRFGNLRLAAIRSCYYAKRGESVVLY